jgi:3-oxoadipate enol-lactonase
MKSVLESLKLFTSGKPENQPIVFLHGFPFDHSMWDEQLEYFKNDYYCITYDIRGLGKSPVGDGQFTIESFVDDLFAIIDELNLSSPIICGLSMGGYIALRAAERAQERLKALVFCDSKPEIDNNEGRLKRCAGIKQINEEGAVNYVKNFIPNCFSKKFIVNEAVKYNYILEKAALSSPAGVKGSLLAMLSRTDTTGFLKEIKIPTLVICGELDSFSTPEQMKATADKIPGAKFNVIPEAGHISPVENAKDFNAALSKFLTRL